MDRSINNSRYILHGVSGTFPTNSIAVDLSAGYIGENEKLDTTKVVSG